MHAVIRRAVDERPAERFADFNLFARALTNGAPPADQDSAAAGKQSAKDLFSRVVQGIQQRSRSSVLAASTIGFGLLFLGYQAAKLGQEGVQQVARFFQLWDNGRARENGPSALEKQTAPDAASGRGQSEAARIEIQEFEAALSESIQRLTFPREKFAAEMDAVAADLYALDPGNTLPPGTRYKPLSEIKERFLIALNALPLSLDVTARGKAMEELRSMTSRIGTKYGSAVREPLEEKVRRLESELNTDAEFRKEQGMKVLKNATKLVNIRPESWEIIRPAQNFTFFGKP